MKSTYYGVVFGVFVSRYRGSTTNVKMLEHIITDVESKIIWLKIL